MKKMQPWKMLAIAACPWFTWPTPAREDIRQPLWKIFYAKNAANALWTSDLRFQPWLPKSDSAIATPPPTLVGIPSYTVEETSLGERVRGILVDNGILIRYQPRYQVSTVDNDLDQSTNFW
jgi:hypothetical protein